MNNNASNTLGRALRFLRQQRGLTQVALAVKAGVSLNTVSLVERSGRITERVANLFAQALQVEPATFRALDSSERIGAPELGPSAKESAP